MNCLHPASAAQCSELHFLLKEGTRKASLAALSLDLALFPASPSNANIVKPLCVIGSFFNRSCNAAN